MRDEDGGETVGAVGSVGAISGVEGMRMTRPCSMCECAWFGVGVEGPGFWGAGLDPHLKAHTVAAGEVGACSLPHVGGGIRCPCRQQLGRV